MSRTKEQRGWDTFSAGIDPSKIKWHRIENLYSGDAMPDVYAINRNGFSFWIENKAIDDWPVRASTCPLRNAFEPGQLAWGRQQRFWRGHSYVLLRVGSGRASEYLLLNPEHDLEEMRKDGLLASAFVVGKKAIIEYLEVMK